MYLNAKYLNKMGRPPKAVTSANSRPKVNEDGMFESLSDYIPQEQVVEYEDPENDDPKPSEWVIFKLVNNNKRGKVRIGGQDEVINPKTGKMDTMFLLSGISEIWGSELRKSYNQEFLSKNRREDMIFDARTLRIPSWDLPAIEFMRNNRNHIEAPNRKRGGKNEYFEYNPQRQAEAALRKEQLVIDAIQAALELTEVAAKKIALFFGISLNDEVGELKSHTLIKRDLAIKAKENPEAFLKTINDPIVEVSYMVSKAISTNKIDISTQAGKAYFATGGFISSIPHGTNARKHLVEFATSNTEAGKDFLNSLKNCLVL